MTTRTEPHPAAVAAMRARIDRHCVQSDNEANRILLDKDALAYDLAAHVLHMDQQARQHGKGQTKELRAKVRHLQTLTGVKATQPQEARLMRVIAGAIQSAINEHGPITPDLKSSAAKRVMLDLTRRRWLNLEEV